MIQDEILKSLGLDEADHGKAMESLKAIFIQTQKTGMDLERTQPRLVEGVGQVIQIPVAVLMDILGTVQGLCVYGSKMTSHVHWLEKESGLRAPVAKPDNNYGGIEVPPGIDDLVYDERTKELIMHFKGPSSFVPDVVIPMTKVVAVANQPTQGNLVFTEEALKNVVSLFRERRSKKVVIKADEDSPGGPVDK